MIYMVKGELAAVNVANTPRKALKVACKMTLGHRLSVVNRSTPDIIARGCQEH